MRLCSTSRAVFLLYQEPTCQDVGHDADFLGRGGLAHCMSRDQDSNS